MTAEVRPVAGADEWSVVAWLWQAFKHDLAPILGAHPRADGRYNRTQLDTWSAAPDTAAYVAWEGEAPVGFAIVAGRFWRLVADELLVDWTEESRAVPGQPDVPPDTWISGSTRP